MNTQSLTRDAADLLPLRQVAELALARHAQAREQAPHRAAVSYLRAALSSARVIAQHAPRHPAWWGEALAIIDRVVAAATTAEAALFAAGKNSAIYLAILIAAESLRLTIADLVARQASENTPIAKTPPFSVEPTGSTHPSPQLPPTPQGTNRVLAHQRM